MGIARSGPTGVRGLDVLFHEGITNYAASTAFLPNLAGFPSPRGPHGSTVHRKLTVWLNKKVPGGSSLAGHLHRADQLPRVSCLRRIRPRRRTTNRRRRRNLHRTSGHRRTSAHRSDRPSGHRPRRTSRRRRPPTSCRRRGRTAARATPPAAHPPGLPVARRRQQQRDDQPGDHDPDQCTRKDLHDFTSFRPPKRGPPLDTASRVRGGCPRLRGVKADLRNSRGFYRGNDP